MTMASRSLRMVSNCDLAAHDDGAAAEMIGAADADTAEDDAAGGKIRPRHDADQVVDAHFRVVDQRHGGVDDLAQIMRRDIGRHADGDAARAIDQQVGEARRQDHRLSFIAVVVRLEIDGVAVDVLEQRHRDAVADGIRCSAWPPADRRRPSRSCPARRSSGRRMEKSCAMRTSES